MSSVGPKVSHHMKEKGWSIVTTASRSGVPVATIKSIIYGKTVAQRISTLEKLAKAFGCTINDLVTEDEDNIERKPKRNFDAELFGECLEAVEEYLQQKNLNISKEKTLAITESLSSLLARKKAKKLSYSIDYDTIEWLLDNTRD